MLAKIKDYNSTCFPICVEITEHGKMIYYNVFPACMTDAEIRFHINSLWNNCRVKDCRKK